MSDLTHLISDTFSFSSKVSWIIGFLHLQTLFP